MLKPRQVARETKAFLLNYRQYNNWQKRCRFCFKEWSIIRRLLLYASCNHQSWSLSTSSSGKLTNWTAIVMGWFLPTSAASWAASMVNDHKWFLLFCRRIIIYVENKASAKQNVLVLVGHPRIVAHLLLLHRQNVQTIRPAHQRWRQRYEERQQTWRTQRQRLEIQRITR